MHTSVQGESRRSEGHSTSRARERFRQAFEVDCNLPEWFESIRFLEGSHSGPNPLAVITAFGQQHRIKVLPNHAAIDNFWECYPDADVLIIVVRANDQLKSIRRQTFRYLSDPNV